MSNDGTSNKNITNIINLILFTLNPLSSGVGTVVYIQGAYMNDLVEADGRTDTTHCQGAQQQQHTVQN